MGLVHLKKMLFPSLKILSLHHNFSTYQSVFLQRFFDRQDKMATGLPAIQFGL